MQQTFEIDINQVTDIVVENITKMIQWLNKTQIVFAKDTSNEFSVSFWIVLLAFFVIDVVVYILLSGTEVKEK